MSFFNDDVNEELEKKSSSFYALEVGQNKFRIVSDFAWGYKFNFKNKAEGEAKGHPFYKLNAKEVDENRIKLVLTACMVVYDYQEKTLKPFNIQQKNILNAIKAYVDNPKFGEPTGYDLVISKKGEGKETRYTVIADPPENPSAEVLVAIEGATINVQNAYINEPIVELKA